MGEDPTQSPSSLPAEHRNGKGTTKTGQKSKASPVFLNINILCESNKSNQAIFWKLLTNTQGLSVSTHMHILTHAYTPTTYHIYTNMCIHIPHYTHTITHAYTYSLTCVHTNMHIHRIYTHTCIQTTHMHSTYSPAFLA